MLGLPRRADARGTVIRDSTLSPANDFFPNVGPQHLRYHDAAILLLVVLHDRDPRAAHRQAAAIQRVRILGLLPAAEADARPARLIGFEIRAGRDLFIPILPG